MTVLRVYMQPDYGGTTDRAEGGIRRVVEAMHRYLPEHGVQFTPEIGRAHLAVGHGVLADRLPDQPFVSCCHGLHWADYEWPAWAHDVNGAVTAALVQAQAITVPSRWVRQAVTRGLLRRPTVIHHGVDADEWTPAKSHGGYVLWNKARADPVSDPREMQKLASHMLDAQFVTTVGRPMDNVRVIGVLPLPQLKETIEQAGVYLATARETFGIGTLEALAAGVPVAGWNYGGQREIIVQGETGYLAPHGDWEALAECVRRCLAERPRLSANARADAVERWGWADKIAQYAELFKRTAAGWHSAERPEISVIVTCHNLGQYLGEALASVQAQEFQNWECLVVDDWSDDDTRAVAARFVAEDSRFAYLRTPRNLGLSGGRNFGAENTTGAQILFLDADDCLPPTALGVLAGSLQAQPQTHIAYGKLALMQGEGKEPVINPWPDGDYDWRAQMAHNNQLHYAALQRREVWVETGGYRERLWRAEDAEYWARATSFGFRAQRVTNQATLVYRLRPDSKGQTEYRTYPDKDGPWTEWFPWKLGRTYAEGMTRYTEPGQPHAALVPFGAQGKSTLNRGHAWNVYHREEPAVSVILPVGPGHEHFLIDALDSLIAQDVGDWEAVVVNDTGADWTEVAGAPWARVVTTGGQRGAGAARNLGLKEARGKLVLFLDADDWLVPGALRKFLRAYADGHAAYVYCDWFSKEQGQKEEIYHRLYDFNQKSLTMQHGMTVLMSREHALAVGPFDETLEAWEDWDWFCKAIARGYCGRRVPEGLYVYRLDAGARRLKATGGDGKFTSLGNQLLATLRGRYDDYEQGVKPMADCCPGGGEAILAAKRAIRESMAAASGEPVPPEPPTTGLGPIRVRLEFIGDTVGARSFHGASGEVYRAGNNPRDRYLDAQAEDVDRLVSLGLFRVVRLPEPPPEVYVDPDPMPELDRTAVEEPMPPAPEGSAFSANGTGSHLEGEPPAATVAKTTKKRKPSAKTPRKEKVKA